MFLEVLSAFLGGRNRVLVNVFWIWVLGLGLGFLNICARLNLCGALLWVARFALAKGRCPQGLKNPKRLEDFRVGGPVVVATSEEALPVFSSCSDVGFRVWGLGFRCEEGGFLGFGRSLWGLQSVW